MSTLQSTHSFQVTWQPGAEQLCLGPPVPGGPKELLKQTIVQVGLLTVKSGRGS